MMEYFNERVYADAFGRGNFEKYVDEFVAYIQFQSGKFVSYANVVSDRVVDIELLNVKTGYYEILGSVRGEATLTRSEIMCGMTRMVTDKMYLYGG